MTENTSHNLALPFIAAAQAQKHVTHNEALRSLDVIVQLSAKSREQINAPENPENGDGYIVGEGGLGAWAAHDNDIAAFQDGAWVFYTPQAGWLCWVVDEDTAYIWNGQDWQILQASGEPSPSDSSSQFGINTDADLTNKLAVKSDAILLSHDDVTPGNGDVRVSVNKSSESNTASLLFQDSFSARAEIGLSGSDDFVIKVSSDGASFKDSLQIDRQNGDVSFPQGIKHLVTGQRFASYIPSPVKEIWRLDLERPATPRTYTLQSASGTVLTLSDAVARTVFSSGMRGNAMIRLWNVSKTPQQSCWVSYDNSTTDLNVTDAGDITDWSAGDILQLGDPAQVPGAGLNVLGMVAIDISPYLHNHLGAVFPQRAVNLVTRAHAIGGVGRVGLSATGAGGSAFDGYSLSDGQPSNASFITPCSVKSPVSDSNLVYLREVLAGTATAHRINFVRILGVWA